MLFVHLQIYNNGYIGLSSTFTGGFTPRPFPFTGAPMIASYWADHDARAGSGRTYFRVSTRSTDLNKAAQLVRCAYSFDITPTQVVIATWSRLGYYSRRTDRVCRSLALHTLVNAICYVMLLLLAMCTLLSFS